GGHGALTWIPRPTDIRSPWHPGLLYAFASPGARAGLPPAAAVGALVRSSRRRGAGPGAAVARPTWHARHRWSWDPRPIPPTVGRTAGRGARFGCRISAAALAP